MRRFLVVVVVLAGCSYTAPGALPTDGPPVDTGDGPIAPLDTDGPTQDVDSDGDGFFDPDDNCPQVFNDTQADEDGDDVGNACDNCPHVVNTNQTNILETNVGQTADAVGDACDPEPTLPGNTIALFMPFDDPTEINTWSGGGGAVFSISGGKLRQTGSTDLGILFKNDLGLAEAFITTHVTYDTVDNARQFRGINIMTRFDRDADFGFGVGCGEMRDSAFAAGAAYFDLMRFDNGGFQHNSFGTTATVAAGHSATYTIHRTSGAFHNCSVDAITFTGTLNLAESDGTGINFAVYGVTASFDYLIAIL